MTWRYSLVLASILFFSGALSATGLLAPHLFENKTPSIPRGWYWANPISARQLHRGDLAFTCPPLDALHAIEKTGTTFLKPGRCPGNYAPFLKVVVALPGDRVRVTDEGIVVNDALLADSKPIHSIKLPRPAPTVLRDDEAWFWSPIERSVDSRYLGTMHPIAIASPLGVVSAHDRTRMAPTYLPLPATASGT
jgi:conjugative transfer signal peptidase TraF